MYKKRINIEVLQNYELCIITSFFVYKYLIYKEIIN